MNTATRLYAVRGAVCCRNTVEDLQQWVPELYNHLLQKNNLTEPDLVSVLFSVTPDITAVNPATALRQSGLALQVPLFACAEPVISGMLTPVIRVMITAYATSPLTPVYLNGAESLRPDLFDRVGSEC